MIAPDNQVVMFVHIPKTAGTSFRTVLGQQFGPHRIFSLYTFGKHRELVSDLASLLADHPGKVRLIQGHVGYGLHDHIPVSLRYITMLREPIKRVVSMYRHIRRDPTHQLHAEVCRMSVGEYVESGIDESAHNSQTRFISGVKLDQELAGVDDIIGYGSYEPDEMLEVAVTNVVEGFLFAGITERFDESVLLMKKLLGFRSVFYARLNNRKGEVLRPTDDDLELIERHNRLDISLYQRASLHMDRKLSEAIPHLEAELRQFRRLNGIVGPFVTYPTRLVHKVYERAFLFG